MAENLILSGGAAIAEMLRCHEVGPVFGMGGFQLLPFYDAIHRLGMTHVLVNDERAGAFAADSSARLTGRPGACDGTLGPGATNLLTGVVESHNAGIPLLVIIGDAHRSYAGRHMTQEAKQVTILEPAAKEVIRIENGLRIPEHMRRAYVVATAGRPGPVVVDVPEDISHDTFEYSRNELAPVAYATRAPAHRIRPDEERVVEAVRLISGARRPVLVAGGGVHLSRAYDELMGAVTKFGLPVAHTLTGKGAIPCAHDLSIGLVGRYSRIANDLIQEADCLVVVGCKLGEIATNRYVLPPSTVPLIQIDIAAEEIGRWTRVDVPLWGDARETLTDLANAVEAREGEKRSSYLSEVKHRMDLWRQTVAPDYASSESPVHMARLIYEIQSALPPEAILVADGGFAAHWTGLLYDTRCAGRTYIANRGFASIGYGLPAAIGAKLSVGDIPVVGLTGDGGLNMALGELETARRLGLGLILIVVNNAASGYVKALQHAMFESRYQSSDLSEVDYSAVGVSVGWQGIRVNEADDLPTAIAAGLEAHDTPTIIDVVVTRDPSRMLPAVDRRTVGKP